MSEAQSQAVLSALDLSTSLGKSKYQELLDTFPAKYPYFRLEYFEVFSGGFERLVCLVWEKGDVVILYPGYLNQISATERCRDFSTPYGYSGPIVNTDDHDSFAEFWTDSDKWLKENYIVSEFIRFALNATKKTYNGELVKSLSNIKGEIIDPEEQWMNFDHKVRKNVKRANRENLTYSIHSGNDMTEDLIQQFHDVYISTMRRNNADARFFYPCSDFMKYVTNNSAYCAFAFVYDQTEMISTEMVLIDDESIYSFMGGTKREFYPKRPNDLLKFELINWARSKHLKYFVLGGGYGADDGIFQYKRAFFPHDVVDWMTGRKVINAAVYDNLCRRNIENLAIPESELAAFHEVDFFPEYRKAYEHVSQ